MKAKLNKRERRAVQLLADYERCERLAALCGKPNADGKKVSVGLLKLERMAHAASEAWCNGKIDSSAWEAVRENVCAELRALIGSLPVGFFMNGDARGYALKLDNENPKAVALITALDLHRDWGGYGILSPTIDGN